MRKISLFDISKTLGTIRKNEGFDYKQSGFLLRRTMSPYMFNNTDVAGFLDFLNEQMVDNIEAIKIIRIHNNFTVSKNTKYIN